MFAFGCQTDEGFVFVHSSSDHVYTYPTESLAREYFGCVKMHSHLYRLEPDLSAAYLVEQGDNVTGAPQEVERTEEQKCALWHSYVYKSMLAWAPYPDEVTPRLPRHELGANAHYYVNKPLTREPDVESVETTIDPLSDLICEGRR